MDLSMKEHLADRELSRKASQILELGGSLLKREGRAIWAGSRSSEMGGGGGRRGSARRAPPPGASCRLTRHLERELKRRGVGQTGKGPLHG